MRRRADRENGRKNDKKGEEPLLRKHQAKSSTFGGFEVRGRILSYLVVNCKKGRVGFQKPYDVVFLKFKVVMNLWISVVIIGIIECNGDE